MYRIAPDGGFATAGNPFHYSLGRLEQSHPILCFSVCNAEAFHENVFIVDKSSVRLAVREKEGVPKITLRETFSLRVIARQNISFRQH